MMINYYTYEQYNAVWCKVIFLEEMSKKFKDDEDIIYQCIEQIHMYHTPESWCDSYQLQESNWQLSQGEHIQIVEEIIKGAIFYQEQEKKEDIERRDELLSYIDFEGGIEAYQNASQKKQEDIRKYIQSSYSPINDDDLLPIQNFVSYSELKNEFLDTIFTKNRRFYFNKSIAETQKSIRERDRDNVPAIIGIDDTKVAMMWFNI